MPEMTPAERVALDTLRKSVLAEMSDADFANLEAEVALKGIRNLDGWFASVVEKAVTEVLKHPGHPDQSVHGGARRKGGASGSAPASAGGGGAPSQREIEAGDKVGYGANQAAERMAEHSNELSQKVYGTNGAGRKMTMTDSAELMGIQDSLTSAAESLTMLSTGKRQGQYDQIIGVRRQLTQTKSDARSALSPAVRGVALSAIDKHIAEVDSLLATHREAWTGVGGTFEKAVEPVVKHPGQHDQSVHGGGKKRRGKSPSPTPAPASADRDGANVEAGQKALDELKAVRESTKRKPGQKLTSEIVSNNTEAHGAQNGGQKIMNTKSRAEAEKVLTDLKERFRTSDAPPLRLVEYYGEKEGAQKVFTAMYGES